jgi:hypothetical protein
MDSVSPKKKKSRIAKKKKIFVERGSFQSVKSSKKGVSAWFPVWQKSPTKWRVAARTNQLRAFDIFQTIE